MRVFCRHDARREAVLMPGRLDGEAACISGAARGRAAGAALLRASDAGASVAGQRLVVDGGWTIA